jgi:hypothetical protein
MKAGIGAFLGLLSGALGMYATAVVDRVVKPPKPVANFAVVTDGLTATFQNHASGESGWWDFGDGSPLEPFDAGQQSVPHTYARPGSYRVTLVVRNFLMEENDRSVPVDLTASPQKLPPEIALSVEPIGPKPVAPATFRIKGEVKNAEKVLVDLGEKLEVASETGPFERLVVFEKPGQFPIQLIGHSGKEAVKKSQIVTVAPPAAGALSVVLRVTETGTRIERRESPMSVAVPLPAKGVARLEKVVPVMPGYTLVEARLGKVASPAVKNLRIEVAADKKSAKLTGEWTATGDGATRKAGGSDVVIPLTLIQEKAVPFVGSAQTVAAAMPVEQAGGGFQGTAVLMLPPQPLGVSGLTRRTTLDVRQATADGRSAVLASAADLKLPWTGKAAGPSVSFHFKAEPLDGEQIKVTMTSGGN